MRAHYDFAQMKSQKNPYVRHLKQPVSMRLDKAIVTYFKQQASDVGMPYQNIINLYLRDCAARRRRLQLNWVP